MSCIQHCVMPRLAALHEHSSSLIWPGRDVSWSSSTWMMLSQSLVSYACNGAWPNAMLFAADACARLSV